MLATNKQKLLKAYLTQEDENLMAFDLDVIVSRLKFLANGKPKNLKVLFPVKSFAHPKILELISKYLDGFDVSNTNEYSLIREHILSSSLIWCSGPFLIDDMVKLDVICDVSSYNKLSTSTTSLRVDPDFLSSYKRRSRFGFSCKELLSDKNLCDISYLHFHYASEQNTLKDYKEIIDYCAKLYSTKKLTKLSVNLGGGFTHFNEKEFNDLFNYLSQFSYINFIIEPGRFISTQSGLLFGRVKDYFEKDLEHYITVSVSSLSHLKWGCEKISFSFFSTNSSTHEFSIDSSKASHILGATCSERDIILKANRKFSFSLDDIIMLSNLNGYCVGWNHSFNGIKAADVRFY